MYLFFRSHHTAIRNYPPKNDSIIAFGDSLIEGYGSTKNNDFVSVLSRQLGKPIVNMGISGETSAQGLSRIQNVLKNDPGTVIVLIGGNDYLQKVAKEQTFSNLRALVTELQSSGSMVVLLGIRGGLIDHFRSDFESLANDTGAIYVPDVLDGIITHSNLMSDEIHPNDAGYMLIANKVYLTMKAHSQ